MSIESSLEIHFEESFSRVSKSNFNIHLIPETLKVTNLSLLEKKQFVNIELDQNTVSIVDTVERVLSR